TSTFALLSLVSLAATARAEQSVEACSSAYTLGQEERLAGHLYSAQKQFDLCADPSCPRAIVSDCERWTREVVSDLPTVLITATTTSGQPMPGLKVTVDGAAVSSGQLLKPFMLDAGQHVLRFEAPGYESLEIEPSLRARDHEVPISAVLRPIAPVASPSSNVAGTDHASTPDRALPVTALTFAGIGVVALGTSVFFGIRAKNEYDDLKASCAPSCASSQASSVHTKAVVSDVALTTSVVAFGAAAYFYFSKQPEQAGATALGLEPTLNGARARLRVSF
ncbi:MAG TPA: hypothetical protein VHW01_05540, partial [Polyangiaceae bacterium]|nr:hypothetical protein [Polyangiaceae bacterium]